MSDQSEYYTCQSGLKQQVVAGQSKDLEAGKFACRKNQ